MTRENGRFSRREFLKDTTLAAAGVALGNTFLTGDARGEVKQGARKDPPDPAGKPRSKVVLIRDKSVITAAGNVDAAVAARMIDEALCELLGSRKPEDAWRQLFGPNDLSGIKTNVYNSLPTPPELNDLLKKRLAACGLSGASIPVADREAHTLLADRTAILNIRPVRTHHWSGIGGCIKNHIMFVTNPSDYHTDSCADLGTIWNLPILKGKTRLNILLALNPLFYGRGPHNFDPRYQWNYCGIFLSRDPVAVDALGAELLRLKRIDHFGEDKVVTPTKHIEMAELRHGLGVSGLKRIDLVTLGWEEDILLK
jgi:hypothetical protein